MMMFFWLHLSSDIVYGNILKTKIHLNFFLNFHVKILVEWTWNYEKAAAKRGHKIIVITSIWLPYFYFSTSYNYYNLNFKHQ